VGCFDCSANAEVQKDALALINAIFQRADLDRRKVRFTAIPVNDDLNCLAYRSR